MSRQSPAHVLVASWILLSGVGACDPSPSGPTGPLERAALASGAANVPVGDELPIELILEDGDGRPVSGFDVRWESSDPSVATVSSDGRVRGVSPGVATVSAEVGGFRPQADVSVGPAYMGGVIAFSSEDEPVHLFTDHSGGVHMEIAVRSIEARPLIGLPVRYVERDGEAFLSVVPEEDGFLPELMRGDPLRFGREIKSPIPGFEPPGGGERPLGLSWQEVRLFPREVDETSDYHTLGYELMLTFQWRVQNVAGPCRTAEETASLIRGILAAGTGEGRRTVISNGRNREPGAFVGEAFLLNPAMADPASDVFLDAGRMEELADAGSISAGPAGRALVAMDELAAASTGGVPWTHVSLDGGDDFCNGLVPESLRSLREEPLEGPPGAVGRIFVQVLNAFQEPVVEVPVEFQVTAGGGVITPEDRTTGNAGEAWTTWTLGLEETEQALNVRVVPPEGTDWNVNPITLRFTARERGPFNRLGQGGRCAVREGGLWCWESRFVPGVSSAVVVEPREGFPLLESVDSGEPSCGLTPDDRAVCWGSNVNGQLGNGTNIPSQSPVEVSGGHRFAQVRTGDRFACGISDQGRALCWGANFTGTLGDGTFQHRNTPVEVLEGLIFADISAGGDHACGVTVEGRGFCWGEAGVLGAGRDTVFARPTPQEVAGGRTWSSIEAGGFHTCGLTVDGEAYCWGWERDGALGNGAATDDRRFEPVAVAGGLTFDHIAVGALLTCGLTVDGEAYCWGDGDSGGIGDGAGADRLTPTAVATEERFEELWIRHRAPCARTQGGAIHCWGWTGPDSTPARIREVW